MSRPSCLGDAAVSRRAVTARALVDNVADVLAGREMIRRGDAKHLDGGQVIDLR